MDRRSFLLGTGALGLAACSAPERDLLEPYEGVDIVLQPEVTTTLDATEAVPDTTTTLADDTPMEQLINSVEPAEDRVGLSFVARTKPEISEIEVFNQPGGDVVFIFANPIASGGDLVFLLDDFNGAGYYRVLVPSRPNGSFGWIDQTNVNLLRHNHRIRVDLEKFALTLLDHDQVVFSTTVGVARENAPTPLGIYYTTELLEPTTPDSVYGAFAYGLSGYSDTFTTFNGGPGQLGIHGTNDPDTLGTNVSSGCIRLHNDDITRLVKEFKVSPGVPVEVI